MPDYEKLKVTELKDLLKSRGMATSGTKSEIITRLKANDKNAGPAGPVEVEIVPEEEVIADIEIVDDAPAATIVEKIDEAILEVPAETVEPSKDVSATATTPASDEASIALKTQQVVDELKKRIKRSEKFGGKPDDESVASLKRIEKFGLQDLDLVNKILGTSSSNGNNNNRRHGGHNNRRQSNNRRTSGSGGRIEKPSSSENSETLRKRMERFASK